jgi:peptidoglycan hydrolase-like protein with peptidoglycan-binding domain
MSNSLSTAALASAFLLSIALSARAAEEQKAPPAKAEKMGEAEKKPAPMGKMSGGSEETKKIQEALKAKGNDPGPIDGVMGPKTRAAVKAFQESNGLKGTGRVDSQTAEKLGVQTTSASMGKETKATKGPEPMSKEPSKEKK